MHHSTTWRHLCHLLSVLFLCILAPASTFAQGDLPVELSRFTADVHGAATLLRWTTASEKNNDHFDVERSFDGREFVRIGQVAGQGSKDSATNYSYLDDQLATSATRQLTIYYRLKQVDTDGTSSYSLVRAVSCVKSAEPAFSVFPTVLEAGQPLRYAYTGPALAADATLEVYDQKGHAIARQPLAEDGSLQLGVLPTGWYWVRLRSDKGSQQVRFYQP